jgi:hypothetical protein
MNALRLTRRSALLLPLPYAACGPTEPASYEPLRYDYLPPIPLNVVSVEIEQRFFPSGVAPDVSAQAPVRPVDALRAMAQDRLRAFGGKDRAVLAIQDATLTRRDGMINGSLAVVLTIVREGGDRAAFVEARVARRESGGSGSLRFNLYQIVRAMMDQMNVELEFQIRRNMKDWLAEGAAASAVPTPVQQAPLAAPTRR